MIPDYNFGARPLWRQNWFDKFVPVFYGFKEIMSKIKQYSDILYLI